MTSQLVASLDHWPDSMAHVEKAGTQAVDPLDLFRGWHRRKDIILEDLKLFANLVDDWEIIIADKVEDRI